MGNLVVQEQYNGSLTDSILIENNHQFIYKYTSYGINIFATSMIMFMFLLAVKSAITEELLHSAITIVSYVIVTMFIVKINSSFTRYCRQSQEFKIKMDLNSFSILVNDVETRGVLSDIEKIVFDKDKYRLTINGKYLYIKTDKLSDEDKKLLDTRLNLIKTVELITV